jgi:hypothetical protein
VKLVLLLPLAVLVASCADKQSAPASAADTGPKPLSQRLNESNGYEVDSNGNWVPRSNKRSSFEAQGSSAYFQGTNPNEKKEYKAGEYSKKSWWGNKDYGRQPYQGNTDGSRFQQSSRLDGKTAPEAGSAARIPDPYQTGTYATGSAREQSNSSLAKPSDTETDIRRRSFEQPEVIDWREQRSLTLDQSRGILGR